MLIMNFVNSRINSSSHLKRNSSLKQPMRVGLFQISSKKM